MPSRGRQQQRPGQRQQQRKRECFKGKRKTVAARLTGFFAAGYQRCAHTSGFPQQYDERRHAEAQYQLGLLYAVGAGLEQDFVQAYKWFSLAANKLSGMDKEIAQEDRDLVSQRMTSAQIAEAQRLVREWKPEDGLPVLAAKDA